MMLSHSAAAHTGRNGAAATRSRTAPLARKRIVLELAFADTFVLANAENDKQTLHNWGITDDTCL